MIIAFPAIMLIGAIAYGIWRAVSGGKSGSSPNSSDLFGIGVVVVVAIFLLFLLSQA
jgi:hypothetical protein